MEKIKKLIPNLLTGVKQLTCNHENKHQRGFQYTEAPLKEGSPYRSRIKINEYYCGDCGKTIKEKIDLTMA